MPVELPQSTRFNFHKGGRDVLGGGKYRGIGDPHRSALGSDRFLRRHPMAEALCYGLSAEQLIRTKGPRNGSGEDISVARIGQMSEQRRRRREILA
jgi:hypothetical protein